MLLFPLVSVNVDPPTSIVVAPSAVGVKVAVYSELLVVAKLLNDPPSTVISSSAKLSVASFDVNINANELSFDVAPLITSEAVIVMVGEVVIKLVVSFE